MITPSHPAAQSTDEACAECARGSGCLPCFEELLKRFQSPLLHFLTRRLRSRHDAEDLVQETFLLAYRNIARYRSSWRFSTWLFTIANRLAISKWRKRDIEPEDRAAEQVGGINPLANAIGNELTGKLWDAVQKILDADAFTAIWLSYVESMAADEIGLVLGRNSNAVRILLHRARVKLADRLGSAEDFSGVTS
jgi:RNA polymerase sigma factor (sigma-70 family)